MSQWVSDVLWLLCLGPMVVSVGVAVGVVLFSLVWNTLP